jgi:hypothetical protein
MSSPDPGPSQQSDDEARLPKGTLWREVLEAMEQGTVGTGGSQLTLVATYNTRTERFSADYSVGGVVIGGYVFGIQERSRRICDLTFVIDPAERARGYATVQAIHERLLESLTGTGVEITTLVPALDGVAWAPYYDWDPGNPEANAMALRDAVTQVQEHGGEARAGLVRRVRSFGGAVAGETRARSSWPDEIAQRVVPAHGLWNTLLLRQTPAELIVALNSLDPGLGVEVFSEMTWYGRRTLG